MLNGRAAAQQDQEDQEMEEGVDPLLGLAMEVTKVAKASSLGPHETLALFRGVARSGRRATPPTSARRLMPRNLKNVQAASAEDLLLHVEAVAVLLQAWSEDGGMPGQDMAEVIEGWVDGVALPLLTSSRRDLAPVLDVLGTRVAQALCPLTFSRTMERVTLAVLGELARLAASCAAAAGKDAALLRTVASQGTWVACFLESCHDKGALLSVLTSTVARVDEEWAEPALRAVFVRAVSPALRPVLDRAPACQARLWAVVLHLDDARGLDGQRDAHGLLCFLHEVLVPELSLARDPAFWSLLCRGLASDCSGVRKRARYVLSEVVARAEAVEGGSAPAGTRKAYVLWWRRFLQAIDTLETANETHLLNQAFPLCTLLLRETFRVDGEEPADSSSMLPAPSTRWGEVLLRRALGVPNHATQRCYLTWMVGQEGEACVPLEKLDWRFVLESVVPACHENNIKDNRATIGRFLARALVAQHGAARRELLTALLRHCCDVASSIVRQTILGFLNHGRDILPQSSPCLEWEDIDLARHLVVANRRYNHELRRQLAALVVTCLEIFGDAQAIARAGPHGARAVRLFLAELPPKVALDSSHHLRLQEWLQGNDRLDPPCGNADGWWAESTAQAVAELVGSSSSSSNKEPQTIANASFFSAEAARALSRLDACAVASCALACFYLPDPALNKVLSPVLTVLGCIPFHPYLSTTSCLASLSFLHALGELLRRKPHPALQEILRREHLGEAADYLASVIQEDVGRLDQVYQEETADDVKALCTSAMGTLVWLAADMGNVAAAALRAVEACAQALEADADGGGVDLGLRRSAAILQGLLENIVPHPGTTLFVQLQERWVARLQASLTRAATRLEKHRRGHVDLSVMLESVWRCLALLGTMQGSPSQHETDNDMGFLLSALETASRDSLPDVLYCVSQRLHGHVFPEGEGGTVEQRQERLGDATTHVLRCLAEGNYRVGITLLAIEMLLAPAFLADPALCIDAASPLRRCFRRLIELGTVKRSHIVVNATARLIQVWNMSPAAAALASAFDAELVTLLLLRELPDDVYSSSNDDHEVGRTAEASTKTGDGPHSSYPVRIVLLFFLVDLFRRGSDGGHQELLVRLLALLFEKAAHVDLRLSQITSSPAFFEKLWAWQAICVLVPFLEEKAVPGVYDSILAAMRLVAVPAVRYYQELSLAFLCQTVPGVALPLLLKGLQDFHVSPLTISSLVFATGLTCLTKPDGGGDALPQVYVGPLLQAILPWLSGQHATTRTVAQMVAFHLLSRLPPEEIARDRTAYLSQTLRFLDHHPDLRRQREKTMKHFASTSVPACCTVAHLLEQQRPSGKHDDLVPAHRLEALLQEAMTTLYREIEAEHVMTYTSAKPVLKVDRLFDTRQELTGGDPTSDTFSLQKKIVVSDVLAALLPPRPPSKSHNARGERLQQLVVCATLLERVPNIAGLARTCEIFAVSKLVIGDAKMTKEPLFESICSSAGQWIEMEEVKEGHTRAFLRRCKEEGMTVVCLEQTDDSACLSTVALPEKMVLLLGRETQGVPVPLLQEVDLVVQIPQLGIVRSLNVHVSASLVVWEYYKQHRSGSK